MRPSDLRSRYPGDGYVAYHAPRYVALLETLAPHLRPGMRVLDVGRSSLTDLIAERFQVRVDTLGFYPDTPIATGQHFQFDLNDAADPARGRRDLPTYDVVVLAEVLEHLYTSPRQVLAFRRARLQPGGLLVVQTPNAAALRKRLKLLVGVHPYERIREDRLNPGHFREYTVSELVDDAAASGLDVVACAVGSHFDYRYRHHRLGRPEALQGLLNLLYRLMPAPLRPGITLVARAR